MKRRKVLWLSEFGCATGFATVAHNLLDQLLITGEYDFDLIGINYFGEPYDVHRWPFAVHPARHLLKAAADRRYADPYGRHRLLEMMKSRHYDLVFTLQDPFILATIGRELAALSKAQGCPWILYYPVDGPLDREWIENTVLLADQPVTYTRYGLAETLRVCPDARLSVIPHGVCTKTFRPLDESEVLAFRRAYFGEKAAKFILTNINRNQARKDIPGTIAAFAAFRRLRPDSFLYLHMKAADVGGDVVQMARYWGLEPGRDFGIPQNFDEAEGIPPEMLNRIYNACDVLVSTTLGEGWGLTVTEAMAARLPVIIPGHTSLTEIGGDGRARLVKNGLRHTCLGTIDNNRYRPLTDLDDLVEALVDCHDHREKYRQTAEKAFQWVQALDWSLVGEAWRRLFADAHQETGTIPRQTAYDTPGKTQ